MEEISNELINFSLLFNKYLNTLMERHCNKNGKKNKDECTLPQIHLLMAIDSIENCTITDIVNKSKLSKPTISILITKLELMHYVKKNFDTKDKRTIVVSLTKKGKDFLEGKKQEMMNFIIDEISHLDKDELAFVKETIKGLNNIMRKYEGLESK